MPPPSRTNEEFYSDLAKIAGQTWPRGKDLLMEQTPYRGVSFVVSNGGAAISFSEGFYRVAPNSKFILSVNGRHVPAGRVITRENYRVGEQTRDVSVPIEGNALVEIIERATSKVIFWARAEYSEPEASLLSMSLPSMRQRGI